MPTGTYFDNADRFGGWQTFSWGYRNKQRRPYKLPLDYDHHTRIQASRLANGSWMTKAIDSYGDSTQPYTLDNGTTSLFDGAVMSRIEECRNAAKVKFNSRVTDVRSGAGINLAQYSQTHRMVLVRLQQMQQLARAVKRRDLGKAVDVLRDAFDTGHGRAFKDPPKKWVGKGPLRWTRSPISGKPLVLPKDPFPHKKFADNWLEWSFGWRPLWKDIHDGTQVFAQGPPDYTHSVKASAGAHYPAVWSLKDSTWDWVANHDITISVRVQARVTITDVNTSLANRLGLLNLGSIVWDAIPWSFVADWFLNVSDVLADNDTEWGLNYSDTFVTTRLVDNLRGSRKYVPTQKVDMIAATSRSMTRRVGSLPNVKLDFNEYVLPWRRAANAAALLSQLTTRFNKR